MTARHLIPVLVVAGLLSACGTGPRVSDIPGPTAGPQNAQDMVNNWDATKRAESVCAPEPIGAQIGAGGKKNDKTVRPACGDYKP